MVKIHHPHLDAVLLMIDRFHRRELVRGCLVYSRKVPVVRRRAGHDLQLLGLGVHPQAEVDAFRVIPSDELGIVVVVPATRQAQIVSSTHTACHDRVFLRVYVHLFLILIQAAVIPVIPKLFFFVPIRELPLNARIFHTIPEDLAAGIIAFNQLTVAVDGIEFIPLLRIVPHAGIHDETLLPVDRFIRNDLRGGVNLESIVGKVRLACQIEPGVGARLRIAVESARHRAVAVVHIYAVLHEPELDHAGMVTRADDHLKQTVVIAVGRSVRRFIGQYQLSVPGIVARIRFFVGMAQIPARRRFQKIFIAVPRPYEGP